MADFLAHIKQLERQLETEPNNETLKLEWIVARSRIEGETVLLELLEDRLFWNSLPCKARDDCIHVVAKQLGEHYEHVETKLYHNKPDKSGLSHSIASFRHLKTGLLLNLIPGGRYFMGTPDITKELTYGITHDGWDRSGCLEKSLPYHEVSIAPFLMGRFLVRQSIWDSLGLPGDSRQSQGPEKPIEGVSWDLCLYWLRKAGGGLRLPSEAEWEYACRAGSTTRFHWGPEQNDEYFWHNDNSQRETYPVTSKQDYCNAFGLADMHGHLREWCEDDAFDDYKQGPNNQEPVFGKSTFNERVVRGGSAFAYAEATIASYRESLSNTSFRYSIGLRVALSLTSKRDQAS